MRAEDILLPFDDSLYWHLPCIMLFIAIAFGFLLGFLFAVAVYEGLLLLEIDAQAGIVNCNQKHLSKSTTEHSSESRRASANT